MTQSLTQLVRGYINLTIDTLTQRVLCPPTPSSGVFADDDKYLDGQTAIITGANTGIGLETARYLARAGALVILACRNTQKAENAASNIISSVPGASLEVLELDLSNMDSVRHFVAKFGTRNCNMLILNGGVMGAPQAKPETHFMTNHVGHALLCLQLLPVLAKDARVVFVSSLTFVVSDLHLDDISFETRPYRWMTAYANSKLAMILFMRALCKRIQGSQITLTAVHPGDAPSEVSRNLGSIWATLHKKVGQFFLLTIEEAARTSVYLASMKDVTQNGKIFHRISEELYLPDWLCDTTVEDQLWQLTLEIAGVSENDVVKLQKKMIERFGDDTGRAISNSQSVD